MAHTSTTIEIAGTKVKVAIGTYGAGTPGKTRTVNVYDQSNTAGHYRQVYRLPDSTGINAAELSKNVSTLQQLDDFLMKKGAVAEGPRIPRSQR